MKKLMLGLLLATPLLFMNCSDDDDAPSQESITYQLAEVDSSGVSGTARFIKLDSMTTRIDVQLSGTIDSLTHPMHIHVNDAAEGGDIAITLEGVNGVTGLSSTTVTRLDSIGDAAGTSINYEGLLEFDGHINVHLSPEELSTIVAQGDIGSNINTP